MTETMWIIGEGILIAVSLVLSAFFSGSETALTSISTVKISQIVGKNDDTNPLSDWLQNPSKYLTTLLVGNNIVNIFGTLLSGDFFRRLFLQSFPDHVKWSGAVAFAAMTMTILVFGEIMPKTTARHHSETLAPVAARVLGNLYHVLRIPIRILMIISNVLLRVSGVETAQEVPFVTSEDLKLMIDVGEKHGLLEEGEREMLHSIFELSETPVREVMTPRVDIIYVDVQDDLENVLKRFEEHDFSRLPVIEDNRDNVVGMLYMKDLLHRWRDTNGNHDLVREMMRPCLFIPANKRIDSVLQQFQREKTHVAIVVDEYGGTAGLVTIEDVLEEIVGEINDEFDEEEELIESAGENTWIVDATIDLEDLGQALELGWDEEDENNTYESLAGYLLEVWGDLPKPGTVIITDDGLVFTVLEADERRITRVKIERPEPANLVESDSASNDDETSRESSTGD